MQDRAAARIDEEPFWDEDCPTEPLTLAAAMLVATFLTAADEPLDRRERTEGQETDEEAILGVAVLP
jgi:hypothetical protein